MSGQYDSFVKQPAVVRQNIGLSLKPIAQVKPIVGYYDKIVITEFPTGIESIRWRPIRCEFTAGETCNEIKAVYAYYINFQNRLQQRLESIFRDTIGLVPTLPYRRSLIETISRVPTLSRHRRITFSWFADVDDLAVIDQSINMLGQTTLQIAHRLEAQQGDLASVSILINEKFDLLEKAFKVQNDAFVQGFRELTDNVRIHNMTLDLLKLTMKELSSFSDALVNMSDFRNALKRGVEGHLDSFFFSRDTVNQMLNNISDEISLKEPNLVPASRNYEEFLTTTKFVMRADRRRLYFILKIAISNTLASYTIFTVHIFPIEMGSNSSYSTILHTNSKALIITGDRHQPYIELDEVPMVTSKAFDTSALGHIWTPRTQRSCLSSAYDNETQFALELCTFHVKSTDFKPKITRLDAQLLWLHEIKNYSLQCGNESTSHTPLAAQTLVRLPCNCSFISDVGEMLPTFQKCQSNPNQMGNDVKSFTNVLNLAVLDCFFKREDIGDITLTSTIRAAFAIKLPDILSVAENISELISGIDERRYELRQVTRAMKNKTALYHSWIESIAEKIREIPRVVPTGNTWGSGRSEWSLFKWDWNSNGDWTF
ncbi:MAG: hypothetical protein ACM31M_04790, partial [Nitrososphaerota archaeon]